MTTSLIIFAGVFVVMAVLGAVLYAAVAISLVLIIKGSLNKGENENDSRK